jgi:hypothetical protein
VQFFKSSKEQGPLQKPIFVIVTDDTPTPKGCQLHQAISAFEMDRLLKSKQNQLVEFLLEHGSGFCREIQSGLLELPFTW